MAIVGIGPLTASAAVATVGDARVFRNGRQLRSQASTDVNRMSAPTGQYLPSRLVNIGTNRWAFKPEIGISQPFGNWFFDASAGAGFFTRNNDFGSYNRSKGVAE